MAVKAKRERFQGASLVRASFYIRTEDYIAAKVAADQHAPPISLSRFLNDAVRAALARALPHGKR
jgi:hypothetical protein